MTTGQKITELRKKNNITQEQLADLLSVSRQSVSKWESDLAYPETEKLISLSKIFKCSVDYLLKEEAAPLDDLHDIALPKVEKSQDQEKSHQKTTINKKGLPFSIASFAFAILTLILFVVPIANASVYVQGYGTIYIAANFYQIVFSSSYSYGNIFFLFDFLITLAVLTLGILYFFFHKKAICLSLKILTTFFTFFYLLCLGFVSDSANAAFFIFFFLYLAYMIVMWSIKPFRFGSKSKTTQTNVFSENSQENVLPHSDDEVMSHNEPVADVRVTKQRNKINKNGLPLSIGGLSFSLLTLILFAVPIIFVSGVGAVSYDINFYQIAFSTNYQIGNTFFTLDFLILLAILTMSILYLFFDKRSLWITLKILTTVFTFFYCLDWILLINNANIAFLIIGLLDLAYMIVMWSIKPFRYNRKMK